MDKDELVDVVSPGAIASLRLPQSFSEEAHRSALALDTVIQEGSSASAKLESALTSYQTVSGAAHVFTHHGGPIFDPSRFRWPSFLYIPKDANPMDYWISPAPADHRYALDWTFPADATANKASRLDGKLFSFSQLHNENASASQSSESGVGVFYKPQMTLGVVALEPTVNCTGSLRTLLEFFPQLAAGFVEVKAELILAAWQQIPGGFDLLGFKEFGIGTSGRRDQTFGPELLQVTSNFDGPSLSTPFVVQSGRTYLLGVVCRVRVISTLTGNAVGVKLPPFNNAELRVWGAMNCIVPEIDVMIRRVDIP